jgi:hypothetical protein
MNQNYTHITSVFCVSRPVRNERNIRASHALLAAEPEMLSRQPFRNLPRSELCT